MRWTKNSRKLQVSLQSWVWDQHSRISTTEREEKESIKDLARLQQRTVTREIHNSFISSLCTKTHHVLKYSDVENSSTRMSDTVNKTLLISISYQLRCSASAVGFPLAGSQATSGRNNTSIKSNKIKIKSNQFLAETKVQSWRAALCPTCLCSVPPHHCV